MDRHLGSASDSDSHHRAVNWIAVTPVNKNCLYVPGSAIKLVVRRSSHLGSRGACFEQEVQAGGVAEKYGEGAQSRLSNKAWTAISQTEEKKRKGARCPSVVEKGRDEETEGEGYIQKRVTLLAGDRVRAGVEILPPKSAFIGGRLSAIKLRLCCASQLHIIELRTHILILFLKVPICSPPKQDSPPL